MKKLFALLAAGLLAVMSGCGGQTAGNESKSSAQGRGTLRLGSGEPDRCHE